MKSYEEDKYAAWRANLEGTLMTYLKRNLLIKTSPASASTRTHAVPDEEKAPSEEVEGSASLVTVGNGK